MLFEYEGSKILDMKYLLPTFVIAIFVLVIGLAYFIGKSANTNKPASTLNSTPTSQPQDRKQSPTPTGKETKKVKGGGILSFPKYELTVPSDWEVKKEVPGPDSERITLKKGEYELAILEGGFGGAACLYPGDPDSEGPSAHYETFVEIKTKSNDLLRRSLTSNGGFAICHKTQYGWGAPTLFGAISFKTPKSYTGVMISEMDAILTSFDRI